MLSMILFLQLSEAQSTGLRRQPAKIAARWRCGLPITNLRAHLNGQFCVSCHYCFDEKPPDTFKRV